MTLLDEIERRHGAASSPHSTGSAAITPPEPVDADVKRGYAVIVSLGMFVVHATLAALARLQYGQDAGVWLVTKEALPAIPIFAALIYILHPLRANRAQAAAATFSVAIGCWLVYLVNEEGYYASMRRAPALGSLWIWLFVELEWYYGALSLAAVAAYLKYNEYSLV